MRIGVIMGGVSSEREVSLASGREIMKHLCAAEHDAVEIVLNTKSDIYEKVQGIDFALLALHGKYGEDGTVQAVLESLDIPYSGCGVLSSSICMDKDMTKTILKSKGIRTADWFVVEELEELSSEKVAALGYPVVVKPNSGGSSVATFICNSFEEVAEGITQGLKVDREVMVEAFVKGDEITVPVLDGTALPTLIIKPQKGGFFDYASKYELGGAVEEIIILPEPLHSAVRAMALDSYKAMKCSVYARVDMILMEGVPYLLELNTLPGMTQTSLFPKSAMGAGLSYADLLEEIIRVSLREHAHRPS